MNFLAIPSFLVALGLIVFVHEFGHHIVAKLFGVRVRVFSLGFGKRLWGFHRDGTDYRISAIPLGGYVRMGGELPDEHSGDPSDFLSQRRWKRILVYAAGPAMNVVLAVSMIAAAFMIGIPEVQAFLGMPSVVGGVAPGSPAEAAGLRAGDRIVRINGEDVDKWKDVGYAVTTSPERPVEVEYLRGGERLTAVVTPIQVPRYKHGEAGLHPPVVTVIGEVMAGRPAARAGFEAGDIVRGVDDRPVADSNDFISKVSSRAGEAITIEVTRDGEPRWLTVVPEANEDGKGMIGIRVGVSIDLSAYQPLPPLEALRASLEYNVEIVVKSLDVLGKLLTNRLPPESSLSGPIEIASISAEAAERGFNHWIHIIGFLSIAIGFMNLMPIPVLDGGHIAILLVESALRRDLSIVVKERVTQLGFMMLMALMAMVIFFDIAKQGWIGGAEQSDTPPEQAAPAAPRDP